MIKSKSFEYKASKNTPVNSKKQGIKSVFDEDSVYDSYVKIPQSPCSSFPGAKNNVKNPNLKMPRSSSIGSNGIEKINNKDLSTDYIYKKTLIPKRNILDKEKLYLENIALKTENHELNSQIVKYKTKIEILEKQINDKNIIIQEYSYNDFSSGKKNLHLANSLKETVKLANMDLKNKDNELKQIKKKLKNCQINELKQEIEKYSEECARLKSILNKIGNEKNEVYESKINDQENLIQRLLKEKQEHAFMAGKVKEENLKLEEQISQMSKKYFSKEKNAKIKELNNSNKDLKAKIADYFLEITEEREQYKKEIGYLRRKADENIKLIDEQCNMIKNLESSNEQYKSEREEFLRKLEEDMELRDGQCTYIKELEGIKERYERKYNEMQMITYQENFEFFPKGKKNDLSLRDNVSDKQFSAKNVIFLEDDIIKECLLHAKFSMQIRNISRVKLPSVIFGNKFDEALLLNENQLMQAFKNSIFSSIPIEKTDFQVFCKYLISPSSISKFSKRKKSSIKNIISLLLKILPK